MILNKITDIIGQSFNINKESISLLVYTAIAAIIIKLISLGLNFLNKKINLNEKQIYTVNKRNHTILTIIFLLTLAVIWKGPLKNTITIISFVSAALTLAAKDIIFNYVCGIYIKLTKPIKIEDRVQIGDYTGDIVNINHLNFELLEVDKITNQSTGIMIHLPNSLIFNTPLKNYTKAFKYIWDEFSIKIDINSDLDLAKTLILKIVTSNSIIKEIPKKMEKEIEQSISKYRIYYNNLTPIIYTKIDDGSIVLTVRFLIHPKKQRNVESDIYNNILKIFSQNNIMIK